MAYETIITEVRESVGIIRFNRPKALNAINAKVIEELGLALEMMENDSNIAAIVLTGNEKAFAAGADINEMVGRNFVELHKDDFIKPWERIAECRKPIIAAVAGFALGGGCEIAMMCDFILAADNAKFGQPEILIGTIPGAGGTQRLTRLVGKSKAMEMILTGRMMDAKEAERVGLVSRVFPVSEHLDQAIETGKTIAGLSRPVVVIAREAVNSAYETTLNEGVRAERRLFRSTFALEDRREGMKSFLDKRKPQFRNI